MEVACGRRQLCNLTSDRFNQQKSPSLHYKIARKSIRNIIYMKHFVRKARSSKYLPFNAACCVSNLEVDKFDSPDYVDAKIRRYNYSERL